MQPVSCPVTQYANRAAISAAVGARIAAAAQEAVARSGRFALAIAPGVLDQEVVRALIDAQLDAKVWEHSHVFWADTDFNAHGDSPARARELIRTLPLARHGTHLDVADEHNTIRAACNYEQMLRGFFGTEMGAVPRFDLIVTALETVQAFARANHPANCDRLAVATFDAVKARSAVMLTPPVISNARAVVLVERAVSVRVDTIVLAASPDATCECLSPTNGETAPFAAEPAASPISAVDTRVLS